MRFSCFFENFFSLEELLRSRNFSTLGAYVFTLYSVYIGIYLYGKQSGNFLEKSSRICSLCFLLRRVLHIPTSAVKKAERGRETFSLTPGKKEKERDIVVFLHSYLKK